ncbi:MAG TPA: T9SS type A sorting domain-containing protein [Sediminibacterium sp.]|nr:T9SS type A sorting domain-containing protein [Sediminibacterium sp.]
MPKIYLLSLLLSAAFSLHPFGVATALRGDDTGDDKPKITHFYPNPATSYINFTFDESVDKSYSLQIYNFMGRKMHEERITDTRITITFDDNYFRGLYIYQLRDKSGRIIESGKFQISK